MPNRLSDACVEGIVLNSCFSFGSACVLFFKGVEPLRLAYFEGRSSNVLKAVIGSTAF